jgi:hypothetical protein
MRTLLSLAMAASFATIHSAPALAQALPADCSKATVPAQPLEISILGTKFAPKSIKLRSAGAMTSGDDQYDSYHLTFRNADDIFAPLEAEVAVIVRKGQSLDGKVFRQLPIKEISKQPSPNPGGQPEVQGWSVKNRDAKKDQSHVTYIASLRLEFGKRQGDSIDGKIYLCVPKGQTTIFDKTPSPAESSAVGTFTAKIDKN